MFGWVPFLTDISKHFGSFWYTYSYLCDLHVDSEEKNPTAAHISPSGQTVN